MKDLISSFLKCVDRQPSVIAIENDKNKISYKDFNVLSRKIAYRIYSFEISQPKVLILMKNIPEAYACMIATLFNDGTFCPVDIDGPLERTAEIVNEFKPDFILVYQEITLSLSENTKVINISNIVTEYLSTSGLSIFGDTTNDVAYVIFTSGSTGKPKGVKISRKAFSYFIDISQKYFGQGSNKKWAQFSNIGYDLAVMDIFMCLCNGGTLVSINSPIEKLFPSKAIMKYNINIWQSVPSVLELFYSSDNIVDELRSLEVMSFCGEPLLSAHLVELFKINPNIVVFNTYGTTETTGFNTHNYLTEDNYHESCQYSTVALGDVVPGWEIKLEGGDIRLMKAK